jgi:hypothetical protein
MSTLSPFRFSDLRTINRLAGWLLLPPALLSVVGIVHLLLSYALLTGLSPDIAIDNLAVLNRMLERDRVLRLTQISLTLVFILFFCFCWLYVAFRNLNALCESQHRVARHGLAIHWHIWSNVLFALRLMNRLWRESTPDSHADRAERWLVPWWWGVLISANVCKVIAIVVLSHPDNVGEWREGSYWMLAAYAFYFGLFVLTWRLVKRLEVLQRAYWRHLNGGARGRVAPAAALS